MTIFGWIYLALTIFGAINVINEIGKPRKPGLVTANEVIVKLLSSAVLFYGLWVWGLH